MELRKEGVEEDGGGGVGEEMGGVNGQEVKQN